MDIDNIKGIMASKFWKKITKNPNYRGYHILDTKSKPPKRRVSGSFFVLLVFFTHKVSNKTALRYSKEGRCVPNRVGGEMLDITEPHEFYGTMKMLRFS